ncbi:MAG: HNH endonuclease [Acidimicrobiaceae bacterium]|nr:HNH endonuclease [Acidimicrobiaceae bacterium]
MVIELVERLDAAASELLACLKGGEASSEELLGVLSGTRAVSGKLDTVQALAAAGVAGSRNHGDGGAHVLAETTGVSRRDARSQVRTITAIGEMPAVRDAVEDGRMSVANAARLADAVDKTSAAEVESDGELLAKAESLPPEQFAKEAKRWTAERQADDGEAEYRRLRARRAVRMWNGDDGMVHLYGQFDPVTGRRIRNRLNRDAHRLLDADKKHARAGGDDKGRARARRGAGSGHVRAGGETRSLQQCMADAFENMTRTTAGGGKPYADIALVARLDPETEKLMASTADGDPLPASVIERLAGESSWFGLVLSAKGVPMWKGRNTRKATESQFQALMALYGGCAGCGEPDENKVHAHHMDPFACGGGTDLDNLIPLCWGCHAKIHDHNWQVVDAGDGKHTIRPPDRIHHGPARLPDTAPLFGLSEMPHSAERERRSASGSGGSSIGTSVNGDRAGPSGPRAARAALRQARAALSQA